MSSMNTQKTGKAYWRSLDELADTPEFRQRLEQEFADYTPEEVIASPTRRSFMKLMGASMALAGVGGLSGCRRWPSKQIAPYTVRPEGRIPGIPEQFATVMELGGVAMPLLISSYDGRPIKAEGNPSHPQSRTREGKFALGACNVFAQASVLEMYDPHRSRDVLNNGAKSSWAAFAKIAKGLADTGKLAVLSEQTSSPTVAAMRQKLVDAGATWYTWEPINRDNELAGSEMAFGETVTRTHLHLDQAKVIACFDADILGFGPMAQAYARDWASVRRTLDSKTMSRMYCVESRMTVTGSNADERRSLASSKVLDAIRLLGEKVGAGTKPAHEVDAKTAAFIERLAADLKANAGKGVIAVGESQPPAVHAAALLINDKLGNLGKTVTLTQEADVNIAQTSQLATLVADLNAEEIKTLVILGGNPVYDAPADLAFADAMKKAATTVHVSTYVDETSKRCTWHLPRSHYLESWGDARAYDGTLSVQQPLIHPLAADSRSVIEVLAAMTGDELTAGYDIVRRTFAAHLPENKFERAWRQVLHDGLAEGTAHKPVSPTVSLGLAGKVNGAEASHGDLELVITPDYSLYDGRFANSGWLQEFPDPITKVTWDNALIVGPSTASKLGLKDGGRATVKVGDTSVTLGVYIQPGQAEGSVSVASGYGRASAGYVGDGVGFDINQLRTSQSPVVTTAVTVTSAGGSYDLMSTQDHWVIGHAASLEREYRAEHHLVQTKTLSEFEHAGEHEHHFGTHAPSVERKGLDGTHLPLQIFDEPVDFEKQRYRWGMSIDLNTCIGCGACIVACQAENNIPVVGKAQVGRGREMHWIRVDRYFVGDPEEPKVVHQPLTCQQCENAPCEQVCPVAATVHDTEGINVMVYNRCIGTRYCSNNCPYKVRRFNWFDWNAKPVKSGDHGATWINIPDQQQVKMIDPVRKMGFNPEVTVRMRGIMEKCTFCIQRIKAVTIPAKNAERSLIDGEITPACAQTCPTQSITFGDLNDKDSQVRKDFGDERAYEILKEMNVRARNRYLTRVTNPGESHDAGHDSHETKSHSNHG
ncbi:MAG: 4Fe-4S dicluster domain-containing protein [Phycisphaera sp.]|nr:4Fe-4S dicluster domain-containing protein [Phycisphaera sp.]